MRWWVPTVAPAGTFRIPAAPDVAGELVAPEGAAARRVYRCPACEGRVDLNAGVKKRRHKLFVARARRSPATCRFASRTFLAFRIARAASCPNGHPALIFAWDGKEPPWPRPPLVIAVEKEVDWTFGRVGGRPTKALPWRRGYASACPKCGAVIGAVR